MDPGARAFARYLARPSRRRLEAEPARVPVTVSANGPAEVTCRLEVADR